RGPERAADIEVPLYLGRSNLSNLFGPVASNPTTWHVLAGLDDQALSRLGNARAHAREMAWAQAARDDRLPSFTVAGLAIPGLVPDLDATLVLCHSEKEHAAKTWKKTFGYHPLLCFLHATGEARRRLLAAARPLVSRCARVQLATGQRRDERGRRGRVRRRRRPQVPLPGAQGPGLDLARHDPAGARRRAPGAGRLRNERPHLRRRRVGRGRASRLGRGRAAGQLPEDLGPAEGVDADGPRPRGRLVGHLLRRA